MSSLPLTPFEEYMLCDDRPEYPMTGFFRLRFSGMLDREWVEAAIQKAIARHPILRSTVSKNAGRTHSWIECCASQIKPDHWVADSINDYPPASYFDLKESIGTRIWLVEREAVHDIVIQVHHACSDALGLCQLIEDFLLAYAQEAGELNDAPWEPLNNDCLSSRNCFGITIGKFLRMLPGLTLGLHVVFKFFCRKAQPLAPRFGGNPGKKVAAVFPSPQTFDFDSEETSEIRAVARRYGVTVNDLLARDLMLAIHSWRTAHGLANADDWIRFFVPVNQRSKDDSLRSASNIMSAVFLERTPRQMSDPENLLNSIHREMNAIKRSKLGFLFTAATMGLNRLPRFRKYVLYRDECASTCVFSNIGVILSRTPLPRRDEKIVMGDIVLEGIDFIAPLRPQTAAAFCVYTYAGRLSVNLHFDTTAISNCQADQLLGILVEQIRTSVRRKQAHHATVAVPQNQPG